MRPTSSPAFVDHAFTEIQVNQVFIGNAGLCSHGLEIVDDVNAHADGELPLEPPEVTSGVWFGVFISSCQAWMRLLLGDFLLR